MECKLYLNKALFKEPKEDILMVIISITLTEIKNTTLNIRLEVLASLLKKMKDRLYKDLVVRNKIFIIQK